MQESPNCELFTFWNLILVFVYVYAALLHCCYACYMLGTKAVAAEFAYVDRQLYVIILCCSVSNDPRQQADGEGSCRDFCLVSRDHLIPVDVLF